MKKPKKSIFLKKSQANEYSNEEKLKKSIHRPKHKIIKITKKLKSETAGEYIKKSQGETSRIKNKKQKMEI